MSHPRTVPGPAARAARGPVPPPGAAAFHRVTAVVVTAGLLLQVVLTAATPGETLPVRLLRLASRFTVEGSVLVAVTSWALAARPGRGVSTLFTVARLDAVAASLVTVAVYAVVLRPVVDPEGWWAVADVLLHYVVPLLVLVGWLVHGPRRRVDRRVVLLALAWPVAFVGWTLLHGAATGYHPYPFLDVGETGWATLLGNVTIALGLLLALCGTLLWLDRRLDAWARARARRPRR